MLDPASPSLASAEAVQWPLGSDCSVIAEYHPYLYLQSQIHTLLSHWVYEFLYESVFLFNLSFQCCVNLCGSSISIIHKKHTYYIYFKKWPRDTNIERFPDKCSQQIPWWSSRLTHPDTHRAPSGLCGGLAHGYEQRDWDHRDIWEGALEREAKTSRKKKLGGNRAYEKKRRNSKKTPRTVFLRIKNMRTEVKILQEVKTEEIPQKWSQRQRWKTGK